MDVRIEAAAATAAAEVNEARVTVTAGFFYKALSQNVEVVASFSCPSIGGTSISAVSPDEEFNDRRLALGVAA